MSDPTPAEVEASGADTIDIDYGGNTYTVPASPDLWDIEVLELAEAGQNTKVIRAVLGDKQYEAFKAANPKVKALKEFDALLQERYGFGSSGN